MDKPLPDRGLLHLLARGEKDIAEGKTEDLETVLAEARALLKEGKLHTG
jgi:hypothetical protein